MVWFFLKGSEMCVCLCGACGDLISCSCELPCTDQDRDEEWTGGVHDNQAEEWNEGGDEDTPTTPSFPKLLASISSSIESLGGGCGIFPKLNWSAPRVCHALRSHPSVNHTPIGCLLDRHYQHTLLHQSCRNNTPPQEFRVHCS